MKRKTKNIITIILISVLLVCMCFTVTNNGDTFYVTNTTATINLTNNKITNNDSKGNFLRVQKDSWGNSGSNGGDVTLNMTNQ